MVVLVPAEFESSLRDVVFRMRTGSGSRGTLPFCLDFLLLHAIGDVSDSNDAKYSFKLMFLSGFLRTLNS